MGDVEITRPAWPERTIMFDHRIGGPVEAEPVPLGVALATTAEVVRLAWVADPKRMLGVLACNVATLAAEFAQLRAGGTALDVVAAGGKPRSQAVRLLTVGALNVVAVASSTAGFVFQARVSQATVREAEGRVLDVVASLELADIEDPEIQDELQRALMGANRQAWLLRHAFSLVPAAGGLATSMVAMNAQDRVLVPLALAGAIPQWILTRRNEDPVRTMGFRSRFGRETMGLRHLLTASSAAHELRAFDATPFLRERHDQLTADANEARMVQERKNAQRGMLGELASKLASAPAGARLLLRLARKETSLSGAVAGGVASRRLASGFQRLVRTGTTLRSAAAVVADYTSFAGHVRLPPTGPTPNRDFQRIVVEDVEFTYRGGKEPVLHGVNLEIDRGEVVALVGENGSGKTTLAKLLCCLYRPTEGRVLWDGLDTAACAPAAVRANIAVVFQDFVRYSSLNAADNIGIGLPARVRDRQAIVEAARRAGAHDIITALPEGYDTVLSRHFGGVDLSTGQWQRVALARAFLRDAPLVVLDEPTAALDPRAERDLFETVASLYRSRSALLISHRLSSVRFADRICVLAGGRITESGTHEELLGAAGTYAELFELQAHAYR